TRMTDATTGVATFSDLYVFGGGGKDLFLTAQAGADLAVSNTFLVKPGGNHLYVATQVPTTAAGAALPDIAVQVLDADGSIDKTNGAGGTSGDTIQLYLDHNPSGAHFVDSSGNPIDTTKNPIRAKVKDGVATFSGIRLDKADTGYTLGVQALKIDPTTP